MLAKVSDLNVKEHTLEKTDPKTYLVVRRWKEYHPHLEDEVENIELLKEDGAVHFLYNLFQDPDWRDVWCTPNGSECFSVEFENESA